MGQLFNMDNKFFTFMGRVADLIILNLVFIICCLPVVTIGASCTAMHYVTLKMVRNEESYIIRSFFKSFKENFKQATIINLIMLLAGVMLILDVNIVKGMGTTVSKVMLCIFIAFAFLYMLVFIYIYPVLAKFYNSIRNTFVNAFLMSIRHLPYTILMLAVTLAPAAILFIPSAQIQSLVLMLFFMMGFAVVAFVNDRLMVKIFDNYIPEEAEDAGNADTVIEDTSADHTNS